MIDWRPLTATLALGAWMLKGILVAVVAGLAAGLLARRE